MRIKISMATLALSLGLSAPSLAVIVPPGEQGFLTGTTEAARPDLGGRIIADTSTSYSVTVDALERTSTGSIQSRVVRNSFGTLDFYWRVVPTYGSTLDLSSFSVDPWPLGSIDTDYRIDGLGAYGPDRLVNNGGIAAAFDLSWIFESPDPAAETSFFFARSDAVRFARTDYSVLFKGQSPDGGPIFFQSQSGETFGPSAAIPEPASWAMLIAGFALVGSAARRPRKTLA